MPQFPRYESQRQLTTQQPSFLASESAKGKILESVGESASKLQGSLQEIADKWQNATDTIQKTVAASNFKAGVLDILQRAEVDPRYNNSDQYLKEIEKMKVGSLQGFSSKSAERETAVNLDYESKVARVQIQNIYRKKMINAGQAATMKSLDMEIAGLYPGWEDRIVKSLGAQAQAGVFSVKDAYNLQKEYAKRGKYNSFLRDLQDNPSLAKNNLSKNAYDLEPAELEKAKKLQDSAAKRDNEARKKEKLEIVNQADSMNMINFAQNWPTGSPCHYQKRKYKDCLGWLHRR